MTYKQELAYWVDALQKEAIAVRKNIYKSDNFLNKAMGKPLVPLNPPKVSKKDIEVVLIDALRADGNYVASMKTRLYIVHGGEYCALLSSISYLNSDGKLNNLRLELNNQIRQGKVI